MMKVAILGCGNMGRAIIKGLLRKSGLCEEIIAYDKKTEALKGLDKRVVVKSPGLWFSNKECPDVVIIAVKPQDIADSLLFVEEGVVSKDSACLWLSIAAGISISELSGYLPDSSHICRVMPNTPALIGKGFSAYSLNHYSNEKDAEFAEKILKTCGKVVNIPEKLMNATTGLSGSGPAYVYLFIEALIEGGVTAGLPYDIAWESAVQTVVGAATMVQETAELPALLKSRVMSPGGTSARGLLELEKNKFKYSVINAVRVATERAAELGKN